MSFPFTPTTLILPGFGDSGPGHWQTLWQQTQPSFVRVVQSDWLAPVRDEWVQTLDQQVARHPEGVLLVAHSLGCLLVAHWAALTRFRGRVWGALLVGVPDPDAEAFPPTIEGFSPLPGQPLPFPATVIASSDDPYATLEHSRSLAAAWGAELQVAGAHGHLNAESGLGPWGWGVERLNELRARAASPEAVVQRQFLAYNDRDLEGWSATYAPDAVQFQGAAQELARGRAAIAARLALRFQTDTASSARLVRRTVLGTSVVDVEVVTRTFEQGVGHYDLVATYEVADGAIASAHFTLGAPVEGPEPQRPQRWVVVFTDTPEMLRVRREREPAHLAYLRAHHDEILIGGGLRPGPGEPFLGGLWVLEVPTRERAVELIEADPYYEPAHRSYRLSTWGKALDGEVLL